MTVRQLRVLESLGVARGRIIVEDHSRNTVENAVYSKTIVQPNSGERWLLVTSAYHMPRAIGVFRKVGISVESYPRSVEGADGARKTKFILLAGFGSACYRYGNSCNYL